MDDLVVQLAFRRWVSYYKSHMTGAYSSLTWPEWREAFLAGFIQ